MPKTDKEEKIRIIDAKEIHGGGGGVVDANRYCKGGGMLDTGKADKI